MNRLVSPCITVRVVTYIKATSVPIRTAPKVLSSPGTRRDKLKLPVVDGCMVDGGDVQIPTYGEVGQLSYAQRRVGDTQSAISQDGLPGFAIGRVPRFRCCALNRMYHPCHPNISPSGSLTESRCSWAFQRT